MAPGLTTRPQPRWGALPHEFAEIRRRANTGWGDRPAWSARIEGRPRPFGQDECRGKLPGACHSAACVFWIGSYWSVTTPVTERGP